MNYSDPYFKLPLLEKLQLCREKAKELFGDNAPLTEVIENALLKEGIKPREAQGRDGD